MNIKIKYSPFISGEIIAVWADDERVHYKKYIKMLDGYYQCEEHAPPTIAWKNARPLTDKERRI